LTLTGPGGCGKTRLMLELAARVQDAYTDGVWLIDLAPLADPGLLPQTVAMTVGVRESADRSLLENLTAALASKQMLLLFDNCEHLIEASARLAHTLLQAGPHLKILATSREPLRVSGELTALTPSLAMPDPFNLPPVELLARYESVQLLVERARTTLPAFTLTAENATAVAQICYQLDGIPLALELAATRVRALSVEQIAARLDNCFQLLFGGRRSALTRQQTLRATLDWSYDLLSAQCQRLLRQLSVFMGGFTLEAVEAICIDEQATEGETLELFIQLVDKSLVVVEPQQQAERYRLLETVRQYAGEKLRSAQEQKLTRVRHQDWYLALAEQSALALKSGGKREWLERLELEHENLRVALRLAQESDPATGLQIAGALAPFWYMRGYSQEGHYWLESLLVGSEHIRGEIKPEIHVRAMAGAGAIAMLRSDYKRAGDVFEQCVELQRKMNDKTGLYTSLNNLGITAHAQGNYTHAYVLYQECLALAQKQGDRRAIARSLLNLSIAERNLEKVEQATAHLEESLAILRDMGEKNSISNALGNLGDIALARGDLEGAKKLLEEGLAILQESGSQMNITIFLRNLGQVAQQQGNPEQATRFYADALRRSWKAHEHRSLASTLEEWACLAGSLGQVERAVSLRGAAAILRQTLGTPIPAFNRQRLEQELIGLRQRLSQEAFEQAWVAGQAMSSDQAVTYALTESD
ncbi:MAG TPA: tetratricopeptide repeat protein, partial [Ktedonobacteraceae bacterium]|nr:tetratricopeptide repeat protein [Ktedonobacteraceae bacterium]